MQLHDHTSNWPSLVDVVDSQCAHEEDEEDGYEHVVDGPDVAYLKEFTDEGAETQAHWYLYGGVQICYSV